MIGAAICAGQRVEVRITMLGEHAWTLGQWITTHRDERLVLGPHAIPWGREDDQLWLLAESPSVSAAEDAVRSILCDCPVRVTSVDVKPIDGGA